MTKHITTLIHPSKKWYLLSIAILLIGPLISIKLLYSALHSPIHTITFPVPGVAKVYFVKPGNYTLWTESKNTAAADKLVQDLQTAKIEITSLDQNQKITLIPKAEWRDKHPPLAHFSFGTLTISKAGYYCIKSQAPFAGIYKVYLRQPSIHKVLTSVAWAIFLSFISMVGSALSAIIILIKRINMHNLMKNDEVNEGILEPKIIVPGDTAWAMVCHLSGFVFFFLPIGNIIAPLLIWGFKRQASSFIEDQGKEAINFQISVTIYYLLAAILVLILVGLILLPLLAAFQIIVMIIASIEASNGKRFRYPLTIRLLR